MQVRSSSQSLRIRVSVWRARQIGLHIVEYQVCDLAKSTMMSVMTALSHTA
jgi:hypothetical protein